MREVKQRGVEKGREMEGELERYMYMHTCICVHRKDVDYCILCYNRQVLLVAP